jgi:Fe(3+) dicitrate transport protein
MRRSLVIAAVLAWPAAVEAQVAGDPSAPTPSAPAAPEGTPAREREAVEVRIIGSKADSLQKVPGSGTIIGSKEIQCAEPYDVAELLNRAPGITARQEQEGGARLDIGVRGLDPGRSRSLLVLEDGIPMSLNPYAEPDLYIAPQIERMRGIEVLKGSGSVLFGPSTVGGIINFLTIAPPPRQSVRVEADYGSFNYKRALAQYGDTFGSARYVVQGSYKAGDGAAAQPFQTVDMFTKVALDTSKTGQAIVKLSFHDDATYAADVGLTREMFAEDPAQATLAPHDRMHQRRYAASLIHEERVGTTTVRTLVYAYETQRFWRRQDLTRTTPEGTPPTDFERFAGDFSVPGAGIFFLNTDTIQDRTYDVAGFEPRLDTHFATGPVGHKLEYGARVLGETAKYEQRSGTMPDSDSGALQSEETHRTVAEAAYVQDTIAFRENLLVTPGVRIEHADFHKIVLRQANLDVNIPGNISSTGVIPGVGMIYGSRENHVFGGIHLGWQPPRVASSFAPNGTPYEVSPQQAINYEVGTRLLPAKWLRGELTGFLISYQNEIIAGASSGGDSAGVAGLTNGGATRHVGVEAAAQAAIGRALGWTTGVDLIARYSFARATFVGGAYDGNLVPYAPLNTFSAVLDVNHPSGFGGEAAFYFTDSQFADPTNIRAEDATGQYGLISAHTNLDANVHYKHRPSGISLHLSVKNALQDYYITERRPNGIAVGGYRQVMLGLRWEWEAKEKAAAAE